MPTAHPVVHNEDGSFRVPTLPVTAEALRRHGEKFEDDGIEDVAAWEGIDLVRPKRRRNEKRIREVHRLFEEHVSAKEIVSRTGLTLETVKKYLAAPAEPMEESGPEMHSTASNGSNPTQTLPAAWNTPKKRSLGTKIVGLFRAGLTVPEAISDRLGKSDRVVRRYLREAEAAGLT